MSEAPTADTAAPDRRGPLVIGTPVVEFEPRAPRSRTYRPDTAVDGWSTGRFLVRGASVRGYQHRHDGTPRQDDFSVTWHAATGAVVVAVADGVSSAELAHVGATLACRAAAERLLRWLDGVGTGADPDAGPDAGPDAEPDAGPPTEPDAGPHTGPGVDPADGPDWADVLRCASWALVEFAGTQPATGPGDQNADQNAERAERLLATTLVAAVIRPNEDGSATVTAARAGDSTAWLVHGSDWTELFVPGQDELVATSVAALPRVPAAVTSTVAELPAGGVLLVGTDGVAGPVGDGRGPVGAALAAGVGSRPTALDLGYLLDFSRETFDDDRTLVAVWPDGHPEPR